MAMPPKNIKNRDVVLPYRRSFITADTLNQTVADVMAEFDKLEMATDELMERFGGDEYLRKLQEFKDELERLKKEFQKELEGITGGDVGKQVEEIKNKLDAISKDEDALTNKLSDMLREDISNSQKEIVEALQKEMTAAKEEIAASEKLLSEEVAGMKKDLSDAKEQWSQVDISEEQLNNIKEALDSDLAEKITAGDELLSAQISGLKKAMADGDSSLATQLEGLKAQTHSNKAEITSMKETQTSDKESTSKALEALEAKYTNVWDAANQASQDAQDAKKQGEMALNSTKYMKTYQLMTEGSSEEQATPALAKAVDDFAGIKELREDMLLHEAKPGMNLVVVDRDTQAPRGNYFWSFEDGQDAKWVEDFKTRVESFGENYLQMAFTYHYDKDFLPKLIPALVLIGGSEDSINSVQKGGSYALIGYQGIKTAQEHVASAETGGKLNLSLSMYRRNVVGLDGFTPSQFREMEDRINSAEERLMQEVKLANARIDGESEARANADGALTKRVELAESKANSNSAAIKAQETTFTDALKAQTERLEGAESKVGQAVASITELEKTVTDKMNAATSKVDGMEAKVLDNEAKIQEEAKARASADEAVAQQVAAMQSTVNGNDALIQSLQKAIADNSSATSQRIDNIIADLDSASKAGVDNALNLDTQSKTIAKVTTDVKAAVDKTTATATQITGLTTRLGTAEGSINDVKKSVSTLDGNVTSRLNSLESTVNTSVKAQIAALEKVVTDKDSAMASKVNSVESKVNANTTRITNEVKTLTDKTNAIASQANTIQADLNGTKTTLQQVSSVASGANNKHEAMWAVRANIGSVPSGFGLAANSDGSTFVVDADRFVIRNRGNKAQAANPFEVINGVVRIKTANIDTAAIVKLAAAQINVKNLNAATITSSTINGGSINIANRFIVDTAGNVRIQAATNNVGLKIVNGQQILVYDAAQKLRVKLGQI